MFDELYRRLVEFSLLFVGVFVILAVVVREVDKPDT